MASALETIEQTILSTFDTGWTAASRTEPIAWPNVDFEPPDGAWVRPEVLWGDGFIETQGSGNLIVGVLNVGIFVRRGIAEALMFTLCDVVRDIVSRVNAANIKFLAASGPQLVTGDPEWRHRVITTPFEARE